MHQTIKQIPAHLAVRAVLPALDLIAALIVFVVGAGVFPQQVVEQFAVWWRQLQRTASLNSFLSNKLPAGSKSKFSAPKRLTALSNLPTGS